MDKTLIQILKMFHRAVDEEGNVGVGISQPQDPEKRLEEIVSCLENLRKNTRMKPIEDRIIVKRDAPQEETPGGIVLPEQAVDTPSRGTVVAVGPGRQLENGNRSTMEVNVGDMVVFGQYGGTNIEIGGEDFVVMRETEVLFVI